MRARGFAALCFFFASLAAAGCTNTGTRCSPACSTAQSCCDGTCASMLVDRTNCGGCGIACSSSEICALGHCLPAMDADVPHDGGRDAAASGNCHPTCAAGYRCCGTTCIAATGIATGDGTSDPSFMNCETCGAACSASSASRCGLPHGTTTGTPHCLCGDSLACDTSGGTMCVVNTTSTSGYSCIDMSTDPLHCGTPPMACASGEICMAGACQCGPAGMSCPTGQTCSSTLGCIDTMTDPMNCGAIGTACRTGETCTGGACGCGTTGTRCAMGGLGMCGQECCGDACIYVDDYNCGGCGVACTGGQVCVKPLLGGVIHCGVEGGITMTCEAPTDAAPSDGGDSPDAGTDDAATDDAGEDASTDDAGNDAAT